MKTLSVNTASLFVMGVVFHLLTYVMEKKTAPLEKKKANVVILCNII